MARLAMLMMLLLVGCGGTPRPTLSLPAAPPAGDSTALLKAAAEYYGAADPAAMRAAVAAAKAAGPDTALYHELAADLARFEDRRDDELDHLLAALMDPGADAPGIYLDRVASLYWTLDDRARINGVLGALRKGHPRHDIRAMAAWMASHLAHREGRSADQKAALKEVSGLLPLALLGTWDNEQGKGFDLVHPPEREIDLSKRYPGSIVDVGWRTGYPIDPRGKVHLHAVLSPNRWQVGYAATAVDMAEAGEYMLRIGTTDPIKVWVNEVLVFAGRRLGVWHFDAVQIPLTLRKGVNRVLIKSAHDNSSAWMLTARLTGPDAKPLPAKAFTVVPADTPMASGPSPAAQPIDEGALLMAAAKRWADGPRKGFLMAARAEELGLRVPRVKIAEALAKAMPKSVRARFLLSGALWDNQERGRTADLLNQLNAEAGDDLALLGLQQARFWRQQKLVVKARALLAKIIKQHPDRRGAYFALASLLDNEKWHEERCQLLESANARWPRLMRAQLGVADCKEKLRFYPQAEAIYRDILKEMPNSFDALRELHRLRRASDDYPAAITYARRWTAAWPHDRGGWRALAETYRRSGDVKQARATLEHLAEMTPTAPDAWHRLAQLAMQAGDRDGAVELWRKAAQRDPENESLANRLEYLAPSKAGPWLADVPTEADIDAAVAARKSITPTENADQIYLMDDEVTQLSPDGSTINVVTMVAHAVNQAGRDRLTRMSTRSSRARIMHAYAVDPDGRRLEASSIRGRTVRFRQLSVGSTVVLQYRVDSRPDGYLASYMARNWWFQAPSVQTRISRWVVWAPVGTRFLEDGLGDYETTSADKGEFVRKSWTAKNTPPVDAEPSMPTLAEVAWHLSVSTVPGWDTFFSWEQALLQDAFRDSPELIALAKDLFKGATTKAEKIERIHAYLMTNIRYQQDYERHIAGVKPHAAPVVIARQYGDCKDKAVLFITLARQAGIDVHFALVRTRDAGPVRKGVPMQQFNHAIVYVPKQPGLDAGRFYDPTVDALDIQVLRHDDQGTLSLVLDPVKGKHYWQPIPYQGAAMDYTFTDTVLTVGADGSATGEMELTSHGRLGSLLRRGARNPQRFGQIMQQQVGRTFPGARLTGHTPVQIDDVYQPAKVRLGVEAPTLGRREGSELRIKIPFAWSPQQYFSLPERTHPVLLGTPRTLRWRVGFDLPAGAKIKRMPKPAKIETPCLTFSRTVSQEKGQLVAQQEVKLICERIPVAQYAAHRDSAQRILKAMAEEAVVDMRRVRANAKTAQR